MSKTKKIEITENITDINDLLKIEIGESPQWFQTRSILCNKIRQLNNFDIPNYQCIVLGNMIIKKLKYNVKYDPKIEELISKILDNLPPQ